MLKTPPFWPPIIDCCDSTGPAGTNQSCAAADAAAAVLALVLQLTAETLPSLMGGGSRTAQVLTRTNVFNGRPYAEEPAILAWDVMNEPRNPQSQIIPGAPARAACIPVGNHPGRRCCAVAAGARACGKLLYLPPQQHSHSLPAAADTKQPEPCVSASTHVN